MRDRDCVRLRIRGLERGGREREREKNQIDSYIKRMRRETEKESETDI